MLGNTGPAQRSHNSGAPEMSSAIVPYAARAVSTRSYARAARTIQMAARRYQSRKRIAKRIVRGAITGYKAARKIQSAFRSFKLRKSIRGATVHTPATDLFAETNLNLGILFTPAVRLSFRSAELPNERRSNTSFVSGIRYCYVFNSRLPPDNKNLDVHFAMVQVRHRNQAVDGTMQAWDSVALNAFLKASFFREASNSLADGDIRTRPFNEANATTFPNYDFGKTCLSLAPERFTVLFHKRFPLLARYANGLSEGGRATHMRREEGYVKINKTINFMNNEDTYGDYPIVPVIWCNSLTRDEWPTWTIGKEYMHVEFRHKVYWRNV